MRTRPRPQNGKRAFGRGFGFLTGALAAFLGTPAHAQDLSRDPDYQALLSLIKPYVYEMAQPTNVYNWHVATDSADETTSTKDPRNYKYIQDAAALYWQDQSRNDGSHGNMYGVGLYGAVDPVTTRRNYGGSGTDPWVLAELKIPAGFRVLDLGRDGGITLPSTLTDAITRLGCPANWQDPSWEDPNTGGRGILNAMLNPDNYKGYPKCATLIRKLFKDDLKIDGFAYQYQATRFADCAQDASMHDRQSAFVITNGDKLKPNNVKLFTAQTQDDPAARLRIQGIFAKVIGHGNDFAGGGNSSPAMVAYLNALNTYQTAYNSYRQASNQTAQQRAIIAVQAIRATLKAQGRDDMIPYVYNDNVSWDATGPSLRFEMEVCANPSDTAAPSVGGSPPPPASVASSANISLQGPIQIQVTRICSHLSGTIDTSTIPGLPPLPEMPTQPAIPQILLNPPPNQATDATDTTAATAKPAALVIDKDKLGSENFLWDDLNGKTVPDDLGQWMRDNLFGCDKVKFRAAGDPNAGKGPKKRGRHSGEDDDSGDPKSNSAQ